MSEPLQSLSLYVHAGAKALLEPCSAQTEVSFAKNALPFSTAQRVRRGGTALRLKFVGDSMLWRNYHQASVRSHKAFLSVLEAQHARGMQYICCADLNIHGSAAGTHFFQNVPKSDEPIEIACLQLANLDKIRFIQLPEEEQNSLGKTIVREWANHGARREDKYGLRVYRLNHHPWSTAETSKSKSNVDARKMLMQAFSDMHKNGWSRAVPFVCTTNDTDTDSIVFFRNPCQRTAACSREFCAVSLERMHKIRLIGNVDEMTKAVFENAVRANWPRVKETNRFADSTQIKVEGQPWCPQTTAQNIESASLVCGFLQELWQQGWRWHCAVDLSTSVADKSTFFLSRGADTMEDDMQQGRIACVLPKGKGKVSFVNFPPLVLAKLVADFSRAIWCTPLVKVERHGTDAATVHFQLQRLHNSQRTDEKILTAKVYTQLLQLVAAVTEGTAMLGTADISGNYYSHTDDNGHTTKYSLDTDAFFLWLPLHG